MSFHKDENCNVTTNFSQCEHLKHENPHISLGKIIAKVPVVLAELTMQVNVDATITFPELVLEIKDVKKHVKLTQCRLLLPTNKLFIKGYVRKNIQYASPSKEIEDGTSKSIASDLHSYTVDIPFQCVTSIKKFLTPPTMPSMNHRQEFDFFISKSLPSGYPEKDEFQSNDLSQYHQESVQHYNEAAFCELVSSKIIEWDEAIDRMPIPGSSPLGEGAFRTVEEKMVLDLTIKVLQKQQIRVTSTTNDKPPHYEECVEDDVFDYEECDDC